LLAQENRRHNNHREGAQGKGLLSNPTVISSSSPLPHRQQIPLFLNKTGKAAQFLPGKKAIIHITAACGSILRLLPI
jgi:hypothetical protein